MTTQTDNAASLPQPVPYQRDPLAELASRIIHDHQDQLPDLSGITVLLPDNLAARQLRRALLAAAQTAGHSALLGPEIRTLSEWARDFLPAEVQVCDEHSRELQLVEALLGQTALLGGANPWTLSENLQQLFDELTLNRVRLPDSLDDFCRQLATGYGLTNTGLAPFSHEARIVHSLWQAWQQQLQAAAQVDTSMAYTLTLAGSLSHIQGQSLYLAGYALLSQVEQDWLTRAGQVARLTQLTPADSSTEPTSDFSRCLTAVYHQDGASLRQRARQFAETVPHSPLQSSLQVYNAHNHEEEARAIDVQIRQWLLAGRQHIGVVTENRRLARRLRALLERAGIPLEDASGWALSTTSAAATLEALLQCLEEDFSHIPFLDLLKSPFIFHDLEANSVEIAVFRLEQDIILQENIARGLVRYRQHLLQRQARLPDWMPEISPTLLGMLDRFEQVQGTCHPQLAGLHPARDYIDQLQAALHTLGIHPALEADAAGQRILQVLDRLQHSASRSELQLGWLDFRSWLGRHLEQVFFKPADSGSPVQLMGLAQSNLQCFDGLIIASAEQEYLPGQPRVSPFFNQAVRRELGLTTASEQRALRFAYFRRLLECADQVLITLRSEQDGEPVTPSPWLAQLQAFHRLAWGNELHADALKQIVAHPDSQVIRCQDTRLPAPQPQPRPSIPAQAIPATISASDYQLIMDCPYHFYTARCLKLAAPEVIREELAKADYGQRVHRCLEAFHSGVPGLPGPFQQQLTESNRQQAIELMNDIAAQHFADDLASNFAHRAWLQLWQAIIPEYIDWQVRRETEWQVKQTELQCENAFNTTVKIKGRLDRIDRSGERLAIVDYKTGRVASNKEVENGEAVQLPFYAMLSKANQQPVSRVEYLKLDRPGNVGSAATLAGEQLEEMMALTEQRLQFVMQQLQNGEGLPAWVDEQKCGWCEMQTICRRQVWEDA